VSDPFLHPDRLRHEVLLLAVGRLETLNRHAAWQFCQDYAGLALTLETARGAGINGQKLGELADLCLARLRRQKVIANKRDLVDAPEAQRAIVLIQYTRTLTAIQELQRNVAVLPSEQHRPTVTRRLEAILSWMRRGQHSSELPSEIVDCATAYAPNEVVRSLIRYAYKDSAIVVDSLLKQAPAYRRNPLFIWLQKEIPQIP
jgi:hypothetical protein